MSTTTAAVFETTTATIIEAIDFPTNSTTHKRHSGGNVLTLVADTMNKGYPSGEWATFKANSS